MGARNIIYIILTILKAVIIITGMVFLIKNLALWLTTKEGNKLKKAAIIFGGIFLSLMILTGIELIIASN